MDASTVVEVGVDSHGHTVVRQLRCEAPLLVRVIDEPGPVLHLALVNGAAGPLGGDTLRFRLHVGAGSHVVVGSVAAAMAQPGPRGDASALFIDVVVDDGAILEWAPQPMVSVLDSNHRTVSHLTATATSRVTFREGMSLGRHGEPSGLLALRQRVVVDGVAVLDHETVFGPGALSGPGAHGDGRTVTSEVVVGDVLPPAGVELTGRGARATFHVAPACALVTTTC